jgi:hypothetical protein
VAQKKKPEFLLTPGVTGAAAIRHIRSSLKMDDEAMRAQILAGARIQVKALIGMDDELVKNMEDIQIEDIIAYRKGEISDPYDVIWDDAEVYESDPAEHEFLEVEELVTQIANSAMTTGVSGRKRVEVKLPELADKLELFVEVHKESSNDIVSTDEQIRELAGKIRTNLVPLASALYESLTKARQAKTALTTRSSRIKAILEVVEQNKDDAKAEYLLNKPIGMKNENLQAWLAACFEEFKKVRPELERFFTSYQKEWETYTSSAFSELLESESASSYFEAKMNQFLTHKLDQIAFSAILAKEHKHPVVADVIREKAVSFNSGVKLTFSVDNEGFHSIYLLPEKFRPYHFGATIHLTMLLNVKFKDKQVFNIDGSDPDQRKIVISTKEIADEGEFGAIQNVLLEGLEKFLTEKAI